MQLYTVSVISDFVIGELCNYLITLLCIAKEVHFKQTAFNNLFCTEASSHLFYSLFIVFSLSLQTSRLPFIFVRICRDTSLFESKRYVFPSSLRGLLWCFPIVKYMKNP